MKQLFALLMALLLIPSALAVYESVLDESIDLVDGGQLQISYPDTVFDDNEFDIVLVPTMEQGVEFNVDIFRDGEAIEKEIVIVPIYGNQSTVVIWNDVLQESATYTLLYERTDGESYEKEFEIFSQDRVIVDRTLHESIFIPTDLTDNQRTYLIQLLEEQGYEYSLGAFKESEEELAQLVDFNKNVYVETLTYNDNSSVTQTVVVIDIAAQEPLDSLNIIETIPKDFAFHVSELSFSQQPIVLEEDPVVMWHLDDVENEKIEYSIKGNASFTGNTVLVTGVARDTNEKSFSKAVLLPLLLIPLIAVIIIFFSKYAPSSKKRRRK